MHYIFLLYAFFIPISKSGVKITTITLLILWLLDSKVKSKILSLFKNKVIFSIILFISFSYLSLLWTTNVSTGIHYLSHYWYLPALAIFSTTLKYKNIPKIISAFLLGMLVSEVLSYGIFFEFWSLEHGTPMDPTPFMHRTFYGLFLSATALLLLNKIFFEEHIKSKILYLFFFLSVSANLFLNSGRTGYVAFTVTRFVLGVLNIKNKLLSFISILILSYQVSPVFKVRFNQAQNSFTKIYNQSENQYNTSFGSRLAIWIVGIEIFKDTPLLGTGTGTGGDMEALNIKVNTSMPTMGMKIGRAHV